MKLTDYPLSVKVGDSYSIVRNDVKITIAVEEVVYKSGDVLIITGHYRDDQRHSSGKWTYDKWTEHLKLVSKINAH